MKIKRLLSAVLCLAMVIGLLSAMSMTASAAVCSTYYIQISHKTTAMVGDVWTLPTSAYLQDLSNGNYGVQNTYSYSVNDTSIAQLSGNTLTFKKSGLLVLSINHGQKFEKGGKNSSHTDTMSITVSSKPDQTCYVGQVINLPQGPSNSYDDAHDNYTISDTTIAQLQGENKLKFLKSGVVTVTNKWQLWDGENPTPKTGTIIRTYEVKNLSAIPSTTIDLDSGAFVGGGVFPKFTVPVGSEYKVSSVSFNREMTDYTVGDRLPMYGAGTSVYLEVSVVAEEGYCFDTKKTYTITYKGTEYEATPIKNGNLCTELAVNMTVNFIGGQIYNPVITGLETPVHRGTPDTKVSLGKNCMVTNVTYYDAATDNEIFSYDYKDEIYVRVAIQVIDDYIFVEGGEAYWTEADINSLPGVKTSETTGYFDFPYVVGAEKSQIIRNVSLSVETPVAGAAASGTLSCNTKGVLDIRKQDLRRSSS